MVEIFRTNVNSKKVAEKVLKSLNARFPACHFNFDLDDCDKILRVQSAGNKIETCTIIEAVQEHEVEALLFED